MTQTQTELLQAKEVALLLEGIIKNQRKYGFSEETMGLFREAHIMSKNGGYGVCPICRRQNSVKELTKFPLNCFHCGSELIQNLAL